jgi:ketosteroid isomerase-like protein
VSEPLSALEVVDRAYRAMAAGDLEGARPYLHADLTNHLLNYNPRHQRVYHGTNGTLELVQQIRVVTDGSYTFDILGLYPAGDELVIVHAVTRVSFEGRSGGGQWVVVARVLDGQIAQIVQTPSTELDHFWRPPRPQVESG